LKLNALEIFGAFFYGKTETGLSFRYMIDRWERIIFFLKKNIGRA